MEPFKFSERSLARLEGVHPDLVLVVKEAIRKSPIDFGVVEGLRSVERQKELVEDKKSQTMNSKHLKQEDGWGHAVDLVPYVEGKASWNWDHILEMANAIQIIFKHYKPIGIHDIRWGGAWTSLNTKKNVIELKEAYVQRCLDEGRKPFLDGPHFEILKK